MSRNDNRGFYNQGAHPCFLDLRREKTPIKPCICVLNEVCSSHVSARVCVRLCTCKLADILEWCRGSVRLGLGEGTGTFRCLSRRGRFHRAPREEDRNSELEKKNKKGSVIKASQAARAGKKNTLVPPTSTWSMSLSE